MSPQPFTTLTGRLFGHPEQAGADLVAEVEDRAHGQRIRGKRAERRDRYVDSQGESEQRRLGNVEGERHAGDEQAQRKSRHNVLAPDPPEPLVVQQVPKRSQKPPLAHVMPFNGKFPKKSPWHFLVFPLRY